MAILLSFDIDGTLEVGDPPGGITMDMVRTARMHGFLIGSCSDRPLSAQRALWLQHDITVDFVSVKDGLDKVRGSLQADRYFHIGDRELDQQLALRAGFDFWWNHEGTAQPWLALLPPLSP